MSTNENAQRIVELQQKLSALREQKNKLNGEAEEWAEKRDKLNEQTRTLRAEIREIRSRRDKLNEKVKELKQLREHAKTKISEKIEETKQLHQQIAILGKRKPSKSLQTLQKKLEGIEWEIQTTTLSLQEEKELVDQVNQLGIQINIYKRLETVHKKLLHLQTDLKTLKTENRIYHEKQAETAHKSQETHNKMLDKLGQVRVLEIEADKLHKSYVKTRQRVMPIQREISDILDHMRLIKEKIQKEEEKEKKKIEEALRKKIEKTAKEKLKRGKQLTWEEFQILAGEGKATHN